MQMLKNKRCDIIANKKIIAFDLDGTLTEAGTNIDQEMSDLLCQLLKHKKVAIISGSHYDQFKKQFLYHLKCADQFKNLLILPVSGTSLYQFHSANNRAISNGIRNGVWKKVYQKVLTVREKSKILNAFKKAFNEIKYRNPKKKYGKIIEDRESQITFAALGQKAPLIEKEKWNKENSQIRFKLRHVLKKYLPEFEIMIGGSTSIDIVKKDIDKAHGITQLLKVFKSSKNDIVYIGDALFKHGNDEAVLKLGIETVAVKSPKETKILIQQIWHF